MTGPTKVLEMICWVDEMVIRKDQHDFGLRTSPTAIYAGWTVCKAIEPFEGAADKHDKARQPYQYAAATQTIYAYMQDKYNSTRM